MENSGLIYDMVNPQSEYKMPVPATGIFDTPHATLRVNTEWLSLITDNLLPMTDERNWVGSDEDKYRATNEILRFLGAMYQVLEDIRILGVMLQKTFGGENWVDVGAVGVASIDVNTGSAGTNASSEYNSTTGALTLTIPRGDVGAEAAFDEPALNPDYTDEVRRCAVATGLVEWLFEKYNDTIDQFEAAADTVSAMDSVIAIFPPGYLVADMVLDALNEIAEFGSSLARTYDTVERRDEHAQWFYCNLQENGGLSQLVWDNYYDWINSEGSTVPSYVAFLGYVSFMKFDAVRARASIESYGSGNCVAFSCNSWSHDFQFPGNGLLGWEIETINLYPSGTGLAGDFNVGTDNVDSVLRRLAISDYRDIALIKISLPEARIITKVQMFGTGTTPSGATATYSTEIFFGGSRIGAARSLGSPSGSYDVPDGVLVDKVTVRISYQKTTSFTGGNGHISGVKLFGEGTDPF